MFICTILSHIIKIYATRRLIHSRVCIPAVRLAISRSEECKNYHKTLFLQRRLQRNSVAADYKRTEVEAEELRKELESERIRRFQLELEKSELEELVGVEQQATKDEEIVRNLATR